MTHSVKWASDEGNVKRTAAMMVEDYGPSEAARLCTAKWDFHRSESGARVEKTTLQSFWIRVRKEIIRKHGLTPRGGE